MQNVTLLSTDAMDDSPWQLTLDGSTKVPPVSAEFGNDKKLGARFPFKSGAAFKKCPWADCAAPSRRGRRAQCVEVIPAAERDAAVCPF